MSTVDLSRWLDLAPFKGSSVLEVPSNWELTDASLRDNTPFYAVVTVVYDTPEGKDEKELVLRRPAPVVFATRTNGGRLEALLVSQTRHGAGTTVLELPGGMGKKGESFEQIAAREFSEEAGVVVDPSKLTLLGTVARDVARSPGLVAPVFHTDATGLPSSAPIVESGEHIAGSAWATRQQILDLTVRGEVIDAVLLSAMTLARAHGVF